MPAHPVILPDADDWVSVLDAALPKLDLLKSVEKEKLVRAMTEVVLHDGRLVATELELLRVSCDVIQVVGPENPCRLIFLKVFGESVNTDA